MKFVKHITWEEIKEAEEYGKETMEFGHVNVMAMFGKKRTTTKLYGRDLERELEKEIEQVLRREGLLDPKEMRVSIAPSDLYWECSKIKRNCFYRAKFAVFDKTRNKIAEGSIYGEGRYYPEEKETQPLSITVKMPTKYVKKLKRLVETLKHIIWG